MNLADAAFLAWPETRRLAATFAGEHAEFRFVGGAVRDTLLGLPVEEVDLATPLLPEEMMQLLQDSGIKALPTGISHGTVTAVIGARAFEITTLRRDEACDGRHAKIAYTADFAADAARRDFTINALYATIEGEVSDYAGGLNDLRAKRLRFIGEAASRVAEDHLRILRYYRFAAQLGWKLNDAEARNACAAAAALIARLSGERIRHEMLKIFALSAPDDAVFTCMGEDGALGYAFGAPALPALAPLVACEAMLELKPDALRRIAYALQQSASPRARLAWLQQRWKLSNAQRAALQLLLNPPLPLTPQPLDQKRLLRRVGKERFTDLVALARAHDASLPVDAMLHLAATWQPPVFPVSGDDLIARGLIPGKSLGETLKKLEAQWEESEYRLSREALLEMV